MMARLRTLLAATLVLTTGLPGIASPLVIGDLDTIVERAREQVERFLVRLSDVECMEEVHQQKLGPNGKVRQEQVSTFHYLVILSSAGGQLTIDESRSPTEDGELVPPDTQLLVSNGFSMLFLILHPHYAGSFELEGPVEDVWEGRRLARVAFRHIPGTRSPAALTLRGREYPLDLSGQTWIDPASGAIARIVASIGDTLADVGLTSLEIDVRFAPAPFRDPEESSWYPVEARVEVLTRKQHWRNEHLFTDYRRFSVSTDEQVFTP